jgi:hypothetical protein
LTLLKNVGQHLIDTTRATIMDFKSMIPVGKTDRIDPAKGEEVCNFILKDSNRPQLPGYMAALENFQGKAQKFAEQVTPQDVGLEVADCNDEIWTVGCTIDNDVSNLVKDIILVIASAAVLDWYEKYKTSKESQSAVSDWEKVTLALGRKGWEAPDSVIALAQGTA